jgi:bifunctional N-acetylglucosamine-1-phosphate-uridyltransferase/glucosamine-1-phosphate-acetyltransferase GlmU-like protein
VITENGTVRIVEERIVLLSSVKLQRLMPVFYIMKTSFVRDFVNSINKSLVTEKFYITELVKIACDAKLCGAYGGVPYDARAQVFNTLYELRGC